MRHLTGYRDIGVSIVRSSSTHARQPETRAAMQGRAMIREVMLGPSVPQYKRETGDALCQLGIDSGTIWMPTYDATSWALSQRLDSFVCCLRLAHAR